MKLAFSSNAYMHFSIEDTIRKIAELGYSGIEILADVPHAWPAGLLEERKESIREQLWKYDLKISNVNAFMMNAVADPRQPYWHPGWTDPDPHYRAIRREHTKRALRSGQGSGGSQYHDRAGRACWPRGRRGSRRRRSSTKSSCRASNWPKSCRWIS